MAVKMVAVKEFDGLEGYQKPGQVFEVTRQDRAEALEAAGLAKYPEEKAVKTKKKEDKEAN